MIKFNKLKPDAQIPTRTSAGSAGYDLHIYEDVTFYFASRRNRSLQQTFATLEEIPEFYRDLAERVL